MTLIEQELYKELEISEKTAQQIQQTQQKKLMILLEIIISQQKEILTELQKPLEELSLEMQMKELLENFQINLTKSLIASLTQLKQT